MKDAWNDEYIEEFIFFLKEKIMLIDAKVKFCDFCFRVIHFGLPCDVKTFIFDNKEYNRVKWGDERKLRDTELPKDQRCPICNVGIGDCHHHGCALEECPRCHSEFMFCGCGKEDYEEHEDFEGFREED
jgi:hypothetical protein